jgi:ferritin-like metal-binding protein YciE
MAVSTLNTLDDVLREQVEDLYSAENQLVHALPKVAQAASSPELRQAFEEHLAETRGHVQRLEEVFGELGMPPASTTCKGMQGLIQEGDEVVGMAGDSLAKDAALIAAAQRIEHYEIAAYGTARTLANELDQGDVARLLSETLDEEGAADKRLTKIATGGMFRSGVNQKVPQ